MAGAERRLLLPASIHKCVKAHESTSQQLKDTNNTARIIMFALQPNKPSSDGALCRGDIPAKCQRTAPYGESLARDLVEAYADTHKVHHLVAMGPMMFVVGCRCATSPPCTRWWPTQYIRPCDRRLWFPWAAHCFAQLHCVCLCSLFYSKTFKWWCRHCAALRTHIYYEPHMKSRRRRCAINA